MQLVHADNRRRNEENDMSGWQGKVFAALLVSGILTVSGCKKDPPAPAPITNGTAQAGTLTGNNAAGPAAATAPVGGPMAVRNQDGSITNPDGSVTYPAGSRVATRESSPNFAGTANSAPAVVPNRVPENRTSPGDRTYGTRPAVSAVAPQSVSLTVPSGTPLVVRLNGGLSASRNEVGDRFSGSLEQPVVSHGQTVFPRGTAVSGSVVAAKGKGRFKGAGDIGIEVTSVGRDRVSTTEYEKSSPGRGKRTVAFGGGGAGLGALIGGLAGGGKGALIGGLAGAGAGTAAGAYTGNRDVVIPAESVITFRTTQSITR